jgi:hypothetical protein
MPVRARRSELYQVDFMAALFGGFVLVWLSGASLSETVTTGERIPTLFSLRARLIYSTVGEPERWLAVLPNDVIDTSCIPVTWLHQLYGSRPLPTTCHGLVVLLNKVGTFTFDEEVSATAAKDGILHEFADAQGIDLTLLDPSNPAGPKPTPIGRVLAKFDSTKQQAPRDALGENMHFNIAVQQEVIEIAPSEWHRVPALAVNNPATIQTQVYSETEKGFGNVEYRFPPWDDELTFDGEHALQLEVVVHWDLSGSNTCFRTVIPISQATPSSGNYGLTRC